jgi:hypothetical protein
MNPRAMLAVAYATGRASHARQVKGDDPDEKGYPGPQGWGSGVGLTTPRRKNNLFRNPIINLGRMRNKYGRKKLGNWKVMKIKQWMGKTKDREQWRLVVEEAKAYPGL